MAQPITEVPTSDLLKQLATQSVELVEKEAELAKAEVVREEESVAESAGVTAVLAIVALQGLVLAAVFGLARLMPDWGAALLVAGIGIVASVAFSLITRRRVHRALPRTREVLSGELAWLKKQLR